MKVTVCFGPVRVVVPCGGGEMLVRDLIRESIRRYKKASGKSEDSWVVVHHLQSQSGILDPDDKLNDVADDREQIIASYDDCIGHDPGVPQGGGDGASGSSVGTSSPDIFMRSEPKYPNENTHIEVTSSEHSTSGLGLQVRRGSEPSLNQTGESTQNNSSYVNTSGNNQDPTKRWSAAPVCRSDSDPPERLLAQSHHNNWKPVPEEDISYSSHNESNTSAFSRSGRLSMQFLGDGGGYRWMEAAERVATNNSNTSNFSNNGYNSKSLPREGKRKEPLGQANAAYESIRDKKGEMLLVLNEQGTSLGLTALPENGGLLVQAVEPGSRAEKGRLRKGDRIVEINGIQLVGLADKTVQEQLKRNLTASELRLRVIRASKNLKRDNRVSKIIDAEEKSDKVKTSKISPTRKIPGAAANASLQAANTRKLGRKIEIILTKGPQGLGFSVTTRDNPAGGYCPIYIKNILPKGAAVEDGRLKPGDRLLEVDGVAMTGKSQTEVVGVLRATQPGATVRLVVSRQGELEDVEEREIGCGAESETKDTPPKPPAPVMPSLKTSSNKPVPPTPPEKPNQNLKDRHGNINLSASLRLKRGSSQNLQNSPVYAGFNLQDNNSVFPWRNREILTLHIPVHDTEKAGLGVSVKGKTGSPNNSNSSGNSIVPAKNDGDLGIFVKSVIHGGAASKDGRLKMNDQLLSVNDVSLLGQSNAEAMDTLRRAMLHTGGKYPGSITLKVARRISRPASIGDPLDSEHSNVSENSGTTVVYLNSNEMKGDQLNVTDGSIHRWSNPVLERLTGGANIYGSGRNQAKSTILSSALRNESYYMATMDNWSPTGVNLNGSNAVLIEEDPEPVSPSLPSRVNDSRDIQTKNTYPTSPMSGDVTYDSQLSLETNPPADAFSRDAIGRRSMSEKHHAALDAKETGTYQRNKKIREERERDKKIKLALSGSMESLADAVRNNKFKKTNDARGEEVDRVTDLGPSLGMKKSSSLESLQTMVQEIQMSDEPRGPVSLKTPRGRGREEVLRAVVEAPPENKPRKHWLLEDGTNDSEGGFTKRNGPLQSSLTELKNKQRQKKPGLLKGIGHMFRFGKHRKDSVAPTVTNTVGFAQDTFKETNGWVKTDDPKPITTVPIAHSHQRSSPAVITTQPEKRSNAPPQYVSPPPAPVHGINSSTIIGKPTAIHQNDLFNHRYSHYVNYDELQHHLSTNHIESSHQIQNIYSVIQNTNSSHVPDSANVNFEPVSPLSESTIEQMRRQVMYQREKVEEESRRHHIYHSTRSTREFSTGHKNPMPSHSSATLGGHHSSRPISTYYEYETATFQPQGSMRKVSNSPVAGQHNSNKMHMWKSNNSNTIVSGGSIKNRGPFVTQVTIRDTTSSINQPPASKV